MPSSGCFAARTGTASGTYCLPTSVAQNIRKVNLLWHLWKEIPDLSIQGSKCEVILHEITNNLLPFHDVQVQDTAVAQYMGALYTVCS